MTNSNIETVENQQENARVMSICNFITLIHGEEATGYRYIWERPKKLTSSFPIEESAKFAQRAINLCNAKRDVYYGICPVPRELGEKERSTIMTVSSVNCVCRGRTLTQWETILTI